MADWEWTDIKADVELSSVYVELNIEANYGQFKNHMAKFRIYNNSGDYDGMQEGDTVIIEWAYANDSNMWPFPLFVITAITDADSWGFRTVALVGSLGKQLQDFICGIRSKNQYSDNEINYQNLLEFGPTSYLLPPDHPCYHIFLESNVFTRVDGGYVTNIDLDVIDNTADFPAFHLPNSYEDIFDISGSSSIAGAVYVCPFPFQGENGDIYFSGLYAQLFIDGLIYWYRFNQFNYELVPIPTANDILPPNFAPVFLFDGSITDTWEMSLSLAQGWLGSYQYYITVWGFQHRFKIQARYSLELDDEGNQIRTKIEAANVSSADVITDLALYGSHVWFTNNYLSNPDAETVYLEMRPRAWAAESVGITYSDKVAKSKIVKRKLTEVVNFRNLAPDIVSKKFLESLEGLEYVDTIVEIPLWFFTSSYVYNILGCSCSLNGVQQGLCVQIIPAFTPNKLTKVVFRLPPSRGRVLGDRIDYLLVGGDTYETADQGTNYQVLDTGAAQYEEYLTKARQVYITADRQIYYVEV